MKTNKEKALKFLHDNELTMRGAEGTVDLSIAEEGVELAVRPDWIRINSNEDLPERHKIVLAFGLNEYNKERILRAIYVAKFSLEDEYDEFSGDSEYSEEKDKYYWPEGWYEFNEHEEIHWLITFEITHYQHLPESPADY